MPGPFVIRQIEHPSKVLELRNAARPLHGLERLAVAQRGTTRRHPGSDVGTALLQGPEDLPRSAEFRWTRRTIMRSVKLGDRVVTDLEELIDIIDAMVRDGALVAVEFAGRTGVAWMKEAHADYDRPHRYDVDIDLEWVAPGQDDTAAQTATGATPDAMDQLRQGWADGMAAVRRPAAVADSVLTGVADAVGSINERIGQLGRVQREYASSFNGGLVASDSYRSMAGTVAAAAAGVASYCGDLRTAADKAPPEWIGTDEPAATVRVLAMRHQLQRLANTTEQDATRARLWALSERRTDILARHVAVGGEDLRLVAFHYLGDAGRWREIATFNGGIGSTLSGGQIVLIPNEGAV